MAAADFAEKSLILYFHYNFIIMRFPSYLIIGCILADDRFKSHTNHPGKLSTSLVKWYHSSISETWPRYVPENWETI